MIIGAERSHLTKSSNKEYHKIIYNKSNNQMTVTLSRKLLGLKKKDKPKKVRLDFKDFDW